MDEHAGTLECRNAEVEGSHAQMFLAHSPSLGLARCSAVQCGAVHAKTEQSRTELNRTEGQNITE